MRLINQLGSLAHGIDERILKLIQDIDVRIFEDAVKLNGSLRDCLCIGDDVSLSDFFKYQQEKGLSSLVQTKHSYYVYNLIFQSIILRYPDIFLKSPMTLITRNKDLGHNHLRIPFNTTGDKERISDLSEAFVLQNTKSSTMMQHMKVIVGEMFSNAMFSAPTNSSGSYLFDKTPRNVRVEYPDGYEGELMLSFNQDIFAIACRDPFGSVNKSRVTRRLHQVFDDERLASIEHADDDSLGSGLGLKMIIEHSAGFGMIVHQGSETLVYATLPVGVGSRKLSKVPKNICFKFY